MKNRNLQIGSDFLLKSLYDTRSLQDGRQEWHPQEQIPLPFKVYQNTVHYPLHQVPPLTLGDPRRAFQKGEEMDGVREAEAVGTRTGASDRRGREGACSSSTQRHVDAPSASESRSVDDGFTPSRPLRAPVPAVWAPVPTVERLDFESLSTLLYYTYGFSRHDEGAGVAWPFHRLVASARCFFPTELYLWLPQTEHIPAGVYHYDNLHHSLALIREGEYRDLLATALNTDLDTSLGVLLISAHLWKTAFKYINFAYRLCTQEAGIVTSNALIVAGTLGYAGRVHYQFLDQPLNRLLGFVPDEESLLAVVPLYAGDIQDGGTSDRKDREGTSSSSTQRHVDAPALSLSHSVEDGFTPSRPLRSPVADNAPSRPLRSPVVDNAPPPLRRLGATVTGQSLSETLAPIALDYVKTTTFDRQLCPILTEMDQHTFLEETSEIVMADDAVPGRPVCLTTEERIAPPAPSPEGIDLAEALHFRSSGDMNFGPLSLPLGPRAFWEIVRYSLTGYNSDLQYAPSSPHLQLYIVVQHVEGIEPGIYRLCADCGMLHVIERGDFVSRVQVLQMAPNVASTPANLVCFLAGDYAALSQLFGNRAYRMMNLEAGLIGHRLSVMSAAQGLTARYSNSYIQSLTKTMLKLKETSIEPFAELVIGYELPGVQAGSRQRFSVLR